MGLAERKSKQVISHDPRNTNWGNDKEKFGYKILKQMGWNPVQSDHIPMTIKEGKGGIGMQQTESSADCVHDFHRLLAKLNGNEAQMKVLDGMAKQSKLKMRFVLGEVLDSTTTSIKSVKSTGKRKRIENQTEIKESVENKESLKAKENLSYSPHAAFRAKHIQQKRASLMDKDRLKEILMIGT